MKHAAMIVTTLAVAMLVTSCASVPRDSGLSDVQTDVAARTSQNIGWNPQPNAAGDPRLRAMLQEPLTADRAVAVAMANNPRLQVILSDLGIARADLIEASTIRNPIFGAEVRFPASPFRPYELTLTQSLIDLITLPRRRQLGRAAFEAAKLRVTSEVLRFGADVRDDYWSLVAASQNVGMARSVLEAARTSAELAQRQHETGNITDLDLENEQAIYEQAKLDAARAEEEVVLRREGVIRALGLRDGSGPWQIENDFPSPPPQEMTEAELEQAAASRRLDIAIARQEVTIAQSALPIARIGATGDADVDVHTAREPSGEKTTGPGIQLPIPIFNRGRAARARAEAQLIRSQQILAMVTTQASSEIRAARTHVIAARARVEYYRDVLLPRRSRILQLTKTQANAMLAGVFQVLMARQNELNARRDSIDAQADYWMARNDLDRVLNGVAATDMFPANVQDRGASARAMRMMNPGAADPRSAGRRGGQ